MWVVDADANGDVNGGMRKQDADGDGFVSPIFWERKRWVNEEYIAYISIGIEYEDSSLQGRKPILAHSAMCLYLHPRTSKRPTSPPLSLPTTVSIRIRLATFLRLPFRITLIIALFHLLYPLLLRSLHRDVSGYPAGFQRGHLAG